LFKVAVPEMVLKYQKRKKLLENTEESRSNNDESLIYILKDVAMK
jgi:hypothetical protein